MRKFEFSELNAFPQVKRYFSAVIFDFDGTLVDSMGTWEEVDERFCELYEVELPSNYIDEITSLSFTETARYFKEELGVNLTIDEIAAEFHRFAFSMYSEEIDLKPGVHQYLWKLRNRGVKIGIATSLSKTLLEASLKKNQIEDFFNAIAFCDECSIGKASSAVYELAAKKLSSDPKDCLVFEDLVTGIQSAKRIGMTTCGVIDKYSHQDTIQLHEASDFTIESFEELL